MRKNMVVRNMIGYFGMETKEGRCTASASLALTSQSFKKLREHLVHELLDYGKTN